MRDRCRLCGDLLPAQPLLLLRGMPGSAQAFPGLKDLIGDHPADLRLAGCPACGLVQSQTAPVSYYREVIRSVAFSPEMGEFRRTQLSEFVATYGLLGRKVLEVGSGRGEYLLLLQQMGVLAFGTEAGTASVRACLDHGLQVEQVFLDEPTSMLVNGPFDAVVCFNFLEHWPEPRATLKALANNLKEGAVGLFEVPNFDMMLRKHMLTEFISDHLLYFTRDTLRSLLEVSGFDVLDVSSIWYDYILSARVRKRAAVSVGQFTSVRQSMRESVHRFLEAHSQKGVAVWGAGHQALAALALLDMEKRVRYVVDSATFKQGKFTPATHLPIHSPEQLRHEPVGAVIVMAAGYSDEVVSTIREEHGISMQIAVLRETDLEVL